MRDPLKGHAALRVGRWSTTDTFYFITICLKPVQVGLNTDELFDNSVGTLKALEGDSCKAVHGVVHMPDHIHLLIELNTETSLHDFVRLYKSRMTPVLGKTDLRWQKGYHDRRLRSNDSVGSVLRYMLMNPYGKGLLGAIHVWPFW
ncbi:MAG: transposase [Opitutales bacterium]|nr:transposase [Opitutales bacterium]